VIWVAGAAVAWTVLLAAQLGWNLATDRTIVEQLTQAALQSASPREARARVAAASLRMERTEVVLQAAMWVAGLLLLGAATLVVRARRIDSRLAEASLREAVARGQRFSEALDRVSARIYTKDLRSRYLYANRPTLMQFGCSADALVGRDDASFFSQADALRLRERDARVLMGEETAEEIELTDARGARRTYWEVNTPIYAEPGSTTIAGLLGISTDISERKRGEEVLQESEARFRKVFEESPLGMVMATINEGRFLRANAAFCRMLGYAEEELQRLTFVDITHPEHRGTDVEAVGRLWKGEVPHYTTEKRYLNPNGDTIWARLVASIIRDNGGTPLYSMAMIEDITAHKSAEAERAALGAQLQQAQKLESVGRLAGGVAHDFNNMLAVILGHSELALGQLDPSHPIHGSLIQIEKAAHHSARLTTQLLAFARRQVVVPQVLDLNDTVEAMLKMLRRLIGEDISLVWTPDARLGCVRIDPTQVDQILANLCVNARDAIMGVGELSIETQNTTVDASMCAGVSDAAPGDYVVLTVRDNGSGMSRDTQARIFEPFFTTKGLGQGTGLGLATVHGIVGQNGGFITVESELGVGTTLRIHLPRHAGEAVGALPRGAVDVPRGRGETVLVVEDDPGILDLTANILERHGYRVLAAGTPEEALRVAREEAGDIDLLVTDVVMPGMNGHDLMIQVVALRPRVKSLFMSGYTADVIARRGVLDADVHFIQKPFTRSELVTKVRQALDRERV